MGASLPYTRSGLMGQLWGTPLLFVLLVSMISLFLLTTV